MKHFASIVLFAVGLIPALVMAAPGKDVCVREFRPLVTGEKVLECTFVGGERGTKELATQQYLTDVGTCWDYDIVAVQSCGCRKFLKASICCRKGGTKDCELRIGNSVEVDCAKYGQAKFGLSGATESDECAKKRKAIGCAKTDAMWAGVQVGPCIGEGGNDLGGVYQCDDAGRQRFADGECGPDPIDCGCTFLEDCSNPAWLKCYKSFMQDAELKACYDFKAYPNNYLRWKCQDDLKKARSGGGDSN
jgi:hypothetical protein